jgi:hypothetical protein
MGNEGKHAKVFPLYYRRDGDKGKEAKKAVA